MSGKRNLYLFICMTVVGALAIVLYACITGNNNQEFTDIIIEYTSRNGYSKSAERALFYIFPIIGATIITIYYFINKLVLKSTSSDLLVTGDSNGKIVLISLLVPVIAAAVIYKSLVLLIATPIVLLVVASLKNKELILPTIESYFLSIYAAIGIYRIYVELGGALVISINMIAGISLIISMIILLLSEDVKKLFRYQLLMQVVIPFTLLIYLSNSYTFSNGEAYSLAVPKRIMAPVLILIIAFVVESIILLKKNWKSVDAFQNVLSYGTIVSIMAFNRFSGNGNIADLDFHHDFENVIAFSQIFELGQTPFEKYIPVSGMYSIFQGFFLWFFGHGYAAYYHITANLFFLAVVMIIAFLLKKQLKAEWVLLISLLFLVKDYNRVALIVPIVLLLTWPKLIENKNLWLKVWFLTSYIHGLYYPVFGAAVCIGFLPLGIWQICTYAKSGQLKEDIKTVKFWGWWIVCFIPVLAGVPLLFGTLQHMLAMGAQTITADGIERFGQQMPENFFAYIPSLPIRMILYYLASYWVVIVLIWLAVALAYYFASKKAIVASLIAVSIVPILLISFSFTVVRFDIADIYSRSDGSIRAAVVILIILAARYIPHNDKRAMYVLGVAIFAVSLISAEGVNNIDSNNKLQAAYDIPEGDIYVNDTNIRLGECFINADTYQYLTRTNEALNTLDKNQSYMGIVDSFGLFYLNDMKGCSVMEIFNTIKGYGATEETIEYIRENKPIVGRNINPDSNYYLYHWLMTSGEYIWNNDLRVFVPNDGSYNMEQIAEAHKNLDLNYADATPLKRTCGSWGSSFNSMKDIFTELNIISDVDYQDDTVKVQMSQAFDGNEADFLYLDFGNLSSNYDYYYDDTLISEYGIFNNLFRKEYNKGTEVTVTFLDDSGQSHSITCDMDEGRLVIPIGSLGGWYYNNHDNIDISVYQDGTQIKAPEIKNIKLLKLRECK